VNERELAELMESLTFRLQRLSEIAEANTARMAGVTEQLGCLRKQATGMANTLDNLRATYNEDVPPAGAPGEQRDAAGTVTRQQQSDSVSELRGQDDRASSAARSPTLLPSRGAKSWLILC